MNTLSRASTPRRSWRLGLICTATLVLAGPAAAMDLLQAYQAALEQDAVIRAARAATESSDERIEQAKAARYPHLSLSGAVNRNILNKSGARDEVYSSHNAGLNLRQPLYRKSLTIELEQAQQIRAESGAQLDRELQNLGVRVADAYLQLLFAQEQLGLVRSQKAVTATQLDAARKLLAAGGGTRTDIDEAQTRLDLSIAQELEARQQVDFGRRQLETLVNQPIDALHPLDEARFADWKPELRSGVQDWLTLAEDASPEIQQLKARLDVARLEIDKARSGHLPTLDATAQWTRSASENVNTPGSRYSQRAIGLQFSVPLYSGGALDSSVRQALAEQLRASELLEATRRDLSLRIHTEFRGVSERLRIQALEQAVRSTEQQVLSARRSFAGGSRTMMDVLNAEQLKEVALRDLARARYTYLMSCIRLQALAGGDRLSSITAVNALLMAPR